ncbi:hypothetical protein ACFLS9_05930 [Bacteroidota bacterium]
MFGNQSILVIGGIMLFTLLLLSFYRSNSIQTTASIYNEAVISASGIAQSLIEEIGKKKFDEGEMIYQSITTDSLTKSWNFGPDSGETYVNQYDDLDDYHNYKRVDKLNRLGYFNSNVQVNYGVPSAPDKVSLARTFYKRVEVKVINQYMPDTLKLYYIASF